MADRLREASAQVVGHDAPRPGPGPGEVPHRSEVSQHRRRELLFFCVRLLPLVLFVVAFFLVPLATLVGYSLGHSTFIATSFGLDWHNYTDTLSEGLYLHLLARSLTIGLITAVLCVVLAYPFGYAVTLGPLNKRGEAFLLAVLVSLFSAYLVRVYAWRTILGTDGVLNSLLQYAGVQHPVAFFLFSPPAVVLTLTNILVPLAILPIYSSLAHVEPALLEAAQDQGAGPLRTLWSVTLPLSIRGVNAAFALTFIFAAGDYVTPALVGGANGQMLGNAVSDQFGAAYNWPVGAVLAITLVVAMAGVIGLWAGLMRLLGFRGALR